MSEFDDAVAKTLNDTKASDARTSFVAATDTNPDAYAEAKRVAQRTGVPVDTALNLPKLMAKQDRIGSIDFDELVKTAPVTASFLASIDNARLAHDDHENLTGFESTLQFGKDMLSNVEAAPYTFATGIYGAGEASARFLSRHLTQPLMSVLPRTQNQADPAAKLADWFAGYADQTQGTADKLTENNKNYGLIGSSVLSGVQSLGAVAASLMVGRPDLALNMFLASSGGQSYHKAVGQGVNADTALVYGASQGIIEKYTESISIGKLLDLAKGQGAVGKTFLQFLGKELTGEEIATLTQDLNDFAILPENKDKTVGDYLAERPAAALSTAIATAVGGSIQGSVVYTLSKAATREQKAQQSEAGAQLVQKINDLASASKVLGRSTESFEQFIEQAADGGPVESVFIDGNTLMQSGVAEELAAVSPSVREQINAAVQTGGQISIPVAEYAAHIAPTEYAQSLIDDLKIDPDGFSRNEAQLYMQSQAEYLQQDIERAMSEKQLDDSFKQSADVVRDNLKQQLNTAGRFTGVVNDAYASAVASFYATTAAKMSMTPEALYEQYPLTVSAESVAGPAFDQSQHAAVRDQEKAQDLIDEIGAFADVSEDGLVTVYHRTDKKSADAIRKSGKMFGRENGLSFSTKPDGRAMGYGDEVVRMGIPADMLELDDIFDGEAHLRLQARAHRPVSVADNLFQFAGQLAKTAPMDRLQQAKAMLADKRSGEYIRQVTGWHKGPDGKWRFEISYDKAELTADLSDIDTRIKLSDALHHDDLFAAYPALADMDVIIDSTMEQGENGQLDQLRANTIHVAAGRSEQQTLSTLLHEVQHAIQEFEDFARGGSSEKYFTDAVKDVLKRIANGKEQDVERWKWRNSWKISEADRTAEIARNGLIYQSAQRLIDYANRDKPSGVRRLIINELQWIYHEPMRDDPDVREIQYRMWDKLPSRGPKRNQMLSDLAFDAAQVFLRKIPEDQLRMFKEDKRTMKGMLNALDREASRARKQLAELRGL